MKLYELQEQLVAIDNILENNTDSETQEILESAKDELLSQIDGKIENILEYISDCKARTGQLKEEEERLYKKRKTLEKKTEYLKGLLFWYMKSNDKKKESFGNWDVSVAKTPDRVVFDIDEEDFPLWLKKVSYSVDKMEVKQRMIDGALCITNDDGDRIQVAHIENGETIRIK